MLFTLIFCIIAQIASTVPLNVHVSISDVDYPKIQKFSFQDSIIEGSLASVTCLALSKTKPINFEWLKNGDKISGHAENLRINTANEVTILIVDPVTSDDSGNYTCLAKNVLGSDKYTAELQVKGICFYSHI